MQHETDKLADDLAQDSENTQALIKLMSTRKKLKKAKIELLKRMEDLLKDEFFMMFTEEELGKIWSSVAPRKVPVTSS